MKKRICVLEDNAEILEIITMILEDQDYEVHGFGTVSQFMSRFASLNPSLFLLDVMLPDGSGLEVCQSLKSAEETRDIPVVIMTANSRIEQIKGECLANDFISKPFDIDYLENTIKMLA